MNNMKKEWPIGGQIRLNAKGTGDYPTIQSAIEAIEQNNQIDITIYLEDGIYNQEVLISGDKPYITIIGQSAENTIIRCNKHAGMILDNGDPASTYRTATFTVYANHFRAINICFENNYDRTQEGGAQAVALYAYGEHHIYDNCRFVGLQDTLYVREGSQYFRNCYIEGDVDFIFGGSRAVFENCTIFGRNPDLSNTDKQGYVCAPCTATAQKFGLFFYKCRIEGNMENDRLYLGRPWHPASSPFYSSAAVFMECELTAIVKKEGWKQMGGYQVKNNRLSEYNNHGPGAVYNDNRRLLTDKEAEEYNVAHVLGWENLGWMPED